MMKEAYQKLDHEKQLLATQLESFLTCVDPKKIRQTIGMEISSSHS